ncbi:MAG TPA: PQQ-binding-like beta-propeller repeat protein [Bacteroidales bacterium]|nr:PQQ-binding-like beta-propeller repeat protein [Bacteroidales bacterium]
MKRTIILAIFLLLRFSLFSQIYQWRGDKRDGHFNESGLLSEWPAEGPGLLFEVEGIGVGFSSPIATEDAIYATGMIDSVDHLTAMDLQGNMIWQVPYGKSWTGSYPDTRSSPTIEGDRVYVLSGTGRLGCFNTGDGSEIWSVEVDTEFEADWHNWGIAESPLIYENMVFCTPGGKKTSVVAFDKMNGRLLWQSESLGAQRSYVSPVIYEFNGQTYILAATARHLIALIPDSGEIVWSYNYFELQEWTSQPGLIWVNSPVFKEDEIFISKGYNHPAVMLKVDPSGRSVSEKYIDRTLDNHHHGIVMVGDYLYGSNWQSNSKGRWVCMNWETGEIMYEHDWFSKGSMVYADGMLYAYVERNGAVGLIRPTPEKFDLVSSFIVRKGTGPHWAHPYIRDGRMYLRHGDFMIVYDIRDHQGGSVL